MSVRGGIWLKWDRLGPAQQGADAQGTANKKKTSVLIIVYSINFPICVWSRPSSNALEMRVMSQLSAKQSGFHATIKSRENWWNFLSKKFWCAIWKRSCTEKKQYGQMSYCNPLCGSKHRARAAYQRCDINKSAGLQHCFTRRCFYPGKKIVYK